MLFKDPIIAALRREEDVVAALDSRTSTIFLMYGEISRFESVIARFKQAGKTVFVHIDLIKGLSSDKEAIDFVASRIAPDGIVTTKGHLVKEAKKFGMKACHQLFMIDTQAFHTGIKSVHGSSPDAVEIMPGLMPSVVRAWKAEVPLPLVVAGLIRSETEIRTMLDAGCDGVAVGDPGLWNTIR